MTLQPCNEGCTRLKSGSLNTRELPLKKELTVCSVSSSLNSPLEGGRPRISKIHCIQIENLKPFFGSQRLRHFVVAALRLVVALSTVGGGCYTPSHLTKRLLRRFVTCVQIAPKGPFNLPFPCISAEHFCRFSTAPVACDRGWLVITELSLCSSTSPPQNFSQG